MALSVLEPEIRDHFATSGQRALPASVWPMALGIVDVNVLYHSLIELASVGSIWSEMATEPRESHNVLEASAAGRLRSSRFLARNSFRIAR